MTHGHKSSRDTLCGQKMKTHVIMVSPPMLSILLQAVEVLRQTFVMQKGVKSKMGGEYRFFHTCCISVTKQRQHTDRRRDSRSKRELHRDSHNLMQAVLPPRAFRSGSACRHRHRQKSSLAYVVAGPCTQSHAVRIRFASRNLVGVVLY